ncbi:hypothetical protein NUW54_g5926 [Trametes sanguinea]|uniref:Uncharacterized protein n=1 Tax=Trametes sanguinea TaxID=158606 RepID=A0ACC1PV73_9APHY|nr:hypothetical protein NUW54_g5926 [Trametes sanguinea]
MRCIIEGIRWNSSELPLSFSELRTTGPARYLTDLFHAAAADEAAKAAAAGDSSSAALASQAPPTELVASAAVFQGRTRAKGGAAMASTSYHGTRMAEVDGSMPSKEFDALLAGINSLPMITRQAHAAPGLRRIRVSGRRLGARGMQATRFGANSNMFDCFLQVGGFGATYYGHKHIEARLTNTPLHDQRTCAGVKQMNKLPKQGSGYLYKQSTMPQTIGYSLFHPPVRLLAWIYEKLVGWTDDYPSTDDENVLWLPGLRVAGFRRRRCSPQVDFDLSVLACRAGSVVDLLEYEMTGQYTRETTDDMKLNSVPSGASRLSREQVQVPKSCNKHKSIDLPTHYPRPLTTLIFTTTNTTMSAYTIHVSGIADATTEQHLTDFFTFCGKITSVEYDREKHTATIHFEKPSAAKTALMLNGGTLDGAHLTITSDQEPQDKDDGAPHHEGHIDQADKPRAGIAAEYLAKGYQLSDQILQRAIELDQQRGISNRFLSYIQSLDAKLGEKTLGPEKTISGKVQETLATATQQAKAVDEQKGITKTASDVRPTSRLSSCYTRF